MRVRCTHTVDDLARDMEELPPRAIRKFHSVVNESIDEGRDITKGFARVTAGAHGKHYPNAITSEMTGVLSGEWGSDRALPQGNMEFEHGSRNQPPHLDHARGADIEAVKFAGRVGDAVDRLFW